MAPDAAAGTAAAPRGAQLAPCCTPPSEPQSFSGIVRHVGKAPGWFSSITVVGVAEEPPEEVFKRFCHPLGHPEVFSSVQAVEELSRTEREGSDGRQLSELEIKQHVRMRLFGKAITAPMRLRLTADHAARQLKFTMLEGNGLMKKVEGVYAVLPLDGDHHSQQDLMRMATTLVNGGQQPALLSSGSGSGSGGGGNAQKRRRAGNLVAAEPRSIVIMHQKVKPFMSPPPPFSRLLRGHLAHQFEHMMEELVGVCQHSMAQRRQRLAVAASAASCAPLWLPSHCGSAQPALQLMGSLVRQGERLGARLGAGLQRQRGLLERGVQGVVLGGALAVVLVTLCNAVAGAARRAELRVQGWPPAGHLLAGRPRLLR